MIFFLCYFLLLSNSSYSFKTIKPFTKLKPLHVNFYSEGAPESISYGKLLTEIEEDKVDNIYFSEDLKKIYTQKLDNDDYLKYTITNSNPILANNVIELSSKKHIDSIILEPPVNVFANGLNLASNVFSSVIYGSLILFFLRSIFGGFSRQNSMNMPFMPGGLRSNNDDKLNMQKANITLSSWAGSPEIFEECFEVVSYLKNSTVYKESGAEIPKGILLEGPPGTGKTLIAKAIASEADANFIAVSASEFIEIFVGLGASKIRDLFKKARENKPCIIFIDEIDSIGRQRGAGINMANDEREQTLNQLLAEMDGFAQNDGVLVIAATNRKDVLDSALLRPGRFDRLINVPLPDKESRKKILNVHMKNKNIGEDINIDFLAELTGGFSGAQLKNLVNEGAINAARGGSKIISRKNIEEALEKLIVGLIKKNDTRSEDARLRVAIHEIGHAFLAATFKEYFDLQKVTIQSTYNGAGGYTLFNVVPEIADGGLYTKDLLKKQLIIALGGKAAEFVFYGENLVSLGAFQDLKQANSIAQRMIGNYGMGTDLEVFYNENIESDRNPFLGRSMGMGDKYSEKTKEKIDAESLELVNSAYKDAIKLILENKEKVDVLVRLLLDNTTLKSDIIYANL
jgi:cell division protease FtsH